MEEERCYTVYMHVNKSNEKVYIGITSKTPERRWRKDGSGYIKANQYFGRAIAKYGWDNFEHIILFKNKTQEEAEYLEVVFIEALLSNNNKYGYNLDGGGNSTGKHSDKTKDKISVANTGNRMSEKSKQELSIRMQGGKHPLAKKVICDEKIFGCITECADYYGVNRRSMSDWLNNEYKTPQEFIDLGLKFIDNNKNDNIRKINKVQCDDEIFDNITKCADYHGVKQATMNRWLNGKSKMPQKFIDLRLQYYNEPEIKISKPVKIRKYKEVICDYMRFNSITECAKYYDVGRRTMNYWLLNPSSMPQKFKDMGLEYYTKN